MSWEAEWLIARMPTREELASHAGDLAAQVGLPPPEVTEREGDLYVQFNIPVAGAEAIPPRLHAWRSLDEVRRDLDPPREQIDTQACLAAGFARRDVVKGGRMLISYLPGHEQYFRVPDHYCTHVNVFAADDRPSRVSVYSNDNDNRAAWPVIHDLGLAIAQRLGIVDDSDDDPPEALTN